MILISPLHADMVKDAQTDINTRLDIFYTTLHISRLNKQMKALILKKEAGAVRHAKSRLKAATTNLLKIEVEKRTDEITGLERVLKKYPASPLIPVVMMRLAELYYEETNHHFMQSMRQYEKELTKGMNPGPPPYISYSKSIRMYKRFIKRFPNHRYTPLAYYLMGYCYGEEGKERLAADSYIEITKRFPASRFIPEVWFRLGEYYFNNNWLSYAENAYLKALHYKNSMFYDMALYKVAWTFFRENKYNQALLSFVQVVDRADKATASEKRESMKKEALEYISLVLGENRTPTDADAFLNKIKWNKYYTLIMKKVGGIYEKLSLHNFAIQAYNDIDQRKPGSIDALNALYSTMKLYEKIGKFGNANKVRLIITNDYSLDSPFMKRIKNPEIKKHAVNLLKKATLSLVTDLIGLSQQSGKHPTPGQYRQTQKVLVRYMRDFPNDKEIPVVHFFYAQIAYKLNEFLTAGEFYKKVALTAMYVDEKYRSDAAFDMVKSYEKSLKLTDTTSYKDRLDGFVAACNIYASLYPESPDAPKILYKAGETLYKAGRYSDAVKVFQKLLFAYRNSKLTMDILKYIVLSYGKNNDRTGLETWGLHMLEYNIFSGNDKAESYVKDVLGRLWFLKAKSAYNKNNWNEAYKYYKKAVAYIMPGQTNNIVTSDKAVYNMGVVLNKMGKIKQAREVFGRLMKEYPSSELIPSAMLELGLSYEKAMRFDMAASMYEAIIKRYQNSAQAKDALYNLAVLKEKTSDYSNAAGYYKTYASRYAGKKEKLKMVFYAAEDYFKSGKTGTALKMYKKICYSAQSLKLSIQSCFKAAKMLEGISAKKSGKLYNRVIFLFNRLNKNENASYVFYYAGARFFHVKQYFRLYSRLKFKSTATLQKVFKRKTNMLAKLNNKLTDIVGLSVPEYAIAALYLDANAYEQFYTDVINSPVPKGLSEEERSLYKSMLAEKVASVKENAVSIYKKTLDKAYQLNIKNKYVNKAKDGLERLYPLESLAYPAREINILKMPAVPVSTKKVNMAGRLIKPLTRTFRGPFLLFYESEHGYAVKAFSIGSD